jgi:hypothetical protein
MGVPLNEPLLREAGAVSENPTEDTELMKYYF